MRILTNLVAKLRALLKDLDQSYQVQIGPQFLQFKVGFNHFDRRTLSFGAILSDRFDHILIGEKIDILMKIMKKGRLCFCHISMKTESPIKVLGSKMYLWGRPRRWVWKKAKKIISKGPIIAVRKRPFFYFLRTGPRPGNFLLHHTWLLFQKEICANFISTFQLRPCIM